MITLIVVLVFLGLAAYIVTQLPLPPPFPVIIQVVILLIAILIVLHFLVPEPYLFR